MSFSIYRPSISKTLYSQGLNGVFCKMFSKVTLACDGGESNSEVS